MRLNSRINPIDAPKIVEKYNIPTLDWSADGNVDAYLQELGRVNIDLGKICILFNNNISFIISHFSIFFLSVIKASPINFLLNFGHLSI